jgi:hypothetical protein
MTVEKPDTAPEGGTEGGAPNVADPDGTKIVESAAEATALHEKAAESRAKTDSDAFTRAMEAMGDEPPVEDPPPPVEDPPPADPPPPGDPPAGDPPPADPPPEDAQESARWAALTQAEQRITQQRREMKADAEVLRREREAFTQQIAGLAKIKAGNAVEGLAELGVSYNDLTAKVLKNGDPSQKIEPHLEPLQKQLAEMEARLKAREEAVTQQVQQQKFEQVLGTIRTQIDAGKEERYELLSTYPGAEHEVFALIETEWKRAGSPCDVNGNPQATLTKEQAADRLEAHLLQETTGRLTAKKVRALLGNGAKQTQKVEAAPSANQGQTKGRRRPKTQTLTNNQSGQVSRGPVDYSDAACHDRALEAMGEAED